MSLSFTLTSFWILISLTERWYFKKYILANHILKKVHLLVLLYMANLGLHYLLHLREEGVVQGLPSLTLFINLTH